ncbi:hypothetical protein JAAARDRAFT_117802 [Jaapia argillacea MUCL 33604]|uniref:N-acetyltransferase domain-containing protein n=1 Tax=Jaapia argillacea MUCL 33604 TaxID=933084 RepID=A0A067QCT3_9AGAM|nr:hypothetical protein JAAARDRAFT_117802 [Jaapia argillacea MUCL 33604]
MDTTCQCLHPGLANDAPTLRPANDGDIPFITEIYNEQIRTSVGLFLNHEVSEENRLAWLRDLQKGAYPCVVVEVDEVREDGVRSKRTIGWCNIGRYRSKAAYDATAEISLYIHRDFRGRGLGSLLLGSVVAEARSRKFHTLLAMVTAQNTDSCRFWGKHGWGQAGVTREVGWKFNQWLDVVTYQIIL